MKASGLSMLLLLFAMTGFLPSAQAEDQPAVGGTFDLQALEAQYGIEIQGIYLLSANYMLQFKYRIIDPEKAAYLTDAKLHPVLIDQASNAAFVVPDPPIVGQLRTTSLKPLANRTYYIIFANPGKFVKSGSKVTVVVGDFRAENLCVN